MVERVFVKGKDGKEEQYILRIYNNGGMSEKVRSGRDTARVSMLAPPTHGPVAIPHRPQAKLFVRDGRVLVRSVRGFFSVADHMTQR